MTDAHERARRWRERNGWTRRQLSELIGYAPETIYWMERGQVPSGRSGERAVKEWVWLRYRRACQGLAAEIAGVSFDW